MRYRLPAAGLAVLLFVSACAVVSGSGQVASQAPQVSGFTKIELSGPGELTIEQGGTESLTIEADDNVLPRLTSEVSDGTLKLDKKRGITLQPRTPIRYRVTLKDLTGLEISGSATVRGEGMRLQSLRLEISGSGVVNLSGSAAEQDIEVSGSGRYEAAELPSEKVQADISGSGQVAVAVSRELKVDISGSGSLTYSGDPSVQQDVSGSGRVIKK